MLLWTTLATSLAAVWVPCSGTIARLFGFVPLPSSLLATALGIVVVYAIATEMTKLRLMRTGPSATAEQ